MGAKLLKGSSSSITLTKIGIRHIRISFPHTFCVRITMKPLERGYKYLIVLVKMCSTQMRFAYMIATHMIATHMIVAHLSSLHVHMR